MSIVLATLCLNEMEWLPKLYEQHKDWPELKRWVFVEAADFMYAAHNPGMTTWNGLSVDGTTDFLRDLSKGDERIKHVTFGISEHEDPARCKGPARQATLDAVADVAPEFFIVLDADEFYPHDCQKRILTIMRSYSTDTAWVFKKREIWHPPSIASEPLFKYEAIDGFWGIPCCHWWRWSKGMNYHDCHVTPSNGIGNPLNQSLVYVADQAGSPQMLHLGFASKRQTRQAKNRYYAERGEKTDPNRAWYVDSRKAFDTWKPGDRLPHKAQVIEYHGPIPECFQ